MVRGDADADAGEGVMNSVGMVALGGFVAAGVAIIMLCVAVISRKRSHRMMASRSGAGSIVVFIGLALISRDQMPKPYDLHPDTGKRPQRFECLAGNFKTIVDDSHARMHLVYGKRPDAMELNATTVVIRFRGDSGIIKSESDWMQCDSGRLRHEGDSPFYDHWRFVVTDDGFVKEATQK